MSAEPEAGSPKKRIVKLLVIGLVAILTPVLLWYFVWRGESSNNGNEAEALAANVQGVGHMERYEYADAEAEFAKALQFAPDWLLALINLGISQFNQNTEESIAKARATFADVLTRDPDNKHAHFCLGVIDSEKGDVQEAYRHFARVTELDPNDAHSWFRVGLTHPDGRDSAAALQAFRKALDLNPYLNAARYNLALALRGSDLAAAKALFAEHKALQDAEWEDESGITYGEMGQYANVIGRDFTMRREYKIGPVPLFDLADNFQIQLAADTRWSLLADLKPVQQQLQKQYGNTVVFLDYNRDGRTDLLALNAVVVDGQVQNLLLANQGKGEYLDVTKACQFPVLTDCLGCACGDYDNDGRIDMALSTTTGVKLVRNLPDGTFADVTEIAAIPAQIGPCLGSLWLDIDQDGDLDFVTCRFSDVPLTVETLSNSPAQASGAIELFENVGLPELGPANAPAAGLSTKFRRSDKLSSLTGAITPTAILTADLDEDHDLDLLVFHKDAKPILLLNDRLLRFRLGRPDWLNRVSTPYAGLILDANLDERADLCLLNADGEPTILLSEGKTHYISAQHNSPALRSAQSVDLDNDGWPDIVGLSLDGQPILMQNQGNGNFDWIATAFGEPSVMSMSSLVALADMNQDRQADLWQFTKTGLQLFHNQGNGNAGIAVQPTGKREAGANLRTTNDGVGVEIVVQSGDHFTAAERATMQAGLGQSMLPTVLGLGKTRRADVVRLRWPDAVLQAELKPSLDGVLVIEETNRKGTSCPVLLTWDGERFVFVTDFLGVGALGEAGPDGAIRPARPEESVKIAANQLQPKNGQYLLKVAEPMDEVMYLDHLELVVLDHPLSTDVFPDERFVFVPPLPTQQLLAFPKQYLPKLAKDHRQQDVTKLLAKRDRQAVADFSVRSWLGYADDHEVQMTFDFPSDNKPSSRWTIVLTGWTEYPYPESIYAATQAGVELQGPVLEQLLPDGKTWGKICDLGFPAGLLRTMTCELPPEFQPQGECRLRIRSNMQVYYDQIYLAESQPIKPVAVLPISSANLTQRGFMKEILPDGHPPIAYDDSQTEAVQTNTWQGHLTKLGDVTELLRQTDDRFVLCGPGDEVTVAFSAKDLPPVPMGYQRSFVLRTKGYCKDTSVTTVTGGQVGPLPFRGMPNYPDFGNTVPPKNDDAQLWHTRPAGKRSGNLR